MSYPVQRIAIFAVLLALAGCASQAPTGSPGVDDERSIDHLTATRRAESTGEGKPKTGI